MSDEPALDFRDPAQFAAAVFTGLQKLFREQTELGEAVLVVGNIDVAALIFVSLTQFDAANAMEVTAKSFIKDLSKKQGRPSETKGLWRRRIKREDLHYPPSPPEAPGVN